MVIKAHQLLRYLPAPFFILLLFSCSPSSFHIVSKPDINVDFMVAPNSNFRFDPNGTIISKYKFYNIEIKNLTTDYYESIEVLNEVKCFPSNSDCFSSTRPCVDGGEVNEKEIKGSKAFAKIKYDLSGRNFWLEINYAEIMKLANQGDIVAEFKNLAKNLLIHFNENENTAVGTNKFKFLWPPSISQSVVEKIWEQIPIPENASLARYVCEIDNEKSFVLLNPKIDLKVDAVELLTDATTGDWQYRLLNSNLITMTKDNKGKTIQIPFLQFEKSAANAMPDNKFMGKKILQASSGDIQLSSTLNKCPFVFLQQKSFKKNNTNSSDAACGGYELDMFECNSVLLHFDNLVSFYDAGNKLIDESKAKYISSFGFRNLVTPQINIILNGNSLKLPLNTTLNQLKIQQNLPVSIILLRLWKGKYVKVNLKNTNDIILLPSDIIKY